MQRKWILTGTIFIVLTILFLYPHIQTVTTHTTSVNDGILITWLSHQSASALSGSGAWYDWPFFYPYKNTATFSDPFITSGALLLIIRQFTTNLALQYNSLLFIALITNFWGMFLLAQKIWNSSFVSIICATVFSFSFTQYQFIPHLHSYLVFGLPLGLWALISYLQTQQKQFAVLWGIGCLLQSLNAPMTGYFYGSVTLLYLLTTQQYRNVLSDYFWWSIVSICAGILIWYYLPYVITAQAFHAARTIRDTAHFSYPIEKLLSVDIVLPLLIVVFSWTRRTVNTSYQVLCSPLVVASFIVVGGLSMLGPVIKVGTETLKVFGYPIPLPYAIFYYIIPGIQAFRSVSRWAVVLNFGIALGLGSVAIEYLRSGKKVLVLSFFAVYLLLNYMLSSRHVYLYEVARSIPEIYATVKATDAHVLAELPFYQWNMGELAGQENQRLRYQLFHHKTLYNGVSGITPPQRMGTLQFLNDQFPSSATVQLLKDAGVALVIVHNDEFTQLEQSVAPAMTHASTVRGSKNAESARMDPRVQTTEALELITCTTQPHDCLYRLH